MPDSILGISVKKDNHLQLKKKKKVLLSRMLPCNSKRNKVQCGKCSTGRRKKKKKEAD